MTIDGILMIMPCDGSDFMGHSDFLSRYQDVDFGVIYIYIYTYRSIYLSSNDLTWDSTRSSGIEKMGKISGISHAESGQGSSSESVDSLVAGGGLGSEAC